MVEKNLTILPVKDPEIPMYEEKWNTVDHRLPKPPFVAVLNAGVSGGKTTTMLNLLYNDNFYRGMFDSVIIASPTIHNDLAWRTALEDDTVKIIDTDLLSDLDTVIQEIFDLKVRETQELEENGEIPKQTLLILDDCLGLLGKAFGKIVSRHRHPRISIMVATQNFRSIPVTVRLNASHYLIFRTNNNKELDKLTEEFASIYGIDNFLKCFQYCTKEKYNFMVLHQRDRKIYHNFDKLIYDDGLLI